MPTQFERLVNEDMNCCYANAERVWLTYGQRHRNRLVLMLPDGVTAAIVLPRGQFLRAGDVLVSVEGRALRIEAAKQTLMKAGAGSSLGLMRMVYHLANRHVRAMLGEDFICFEPDPVLGDLVRQLGGSVELVESVFEPEAGAYSAGHRHDDLEPHDFAMGHVGEQLSIAAHQSRGQHVKS